MILIFTAGCTVSATGETDRQEQNKAAIEKARANIESFRKGAIRLKAVDANGKPAASTKLEIRQVSHDFKFGCYLKIDDIDQAKLPEYERRFKDLFNYAVIGTYWSFVEKKAGDADWSWFDREAAIADKLGIGVGAAPILWGTNKFGTPQWLPKHGNDLIPILERHVRTSLKRNSSVLEWEIVNEPMARKADVFAAGAGNGYITSAFGWARDAAPSKRLLINDYGVFGSLKAHNFNQDRYFRLLEKLILDETPIDVIGIQAHANGEWFEPADVAEQMEKYAALGKPIQITEFSAQTAELGGRRSQLPISGNYRTGTWDDEKQADFYREFYTIAFGNPHVEGIITWGLDDERAWLPGIGLIDKNGEPKAAYRELDRLINYEWKSRFDAITDERGSFEFQGFFGNYEVTATNASGKTSKARFRAAYGNANDWVIRLDK